MTTTSHPSPPVGADDGAGIADAGRPAGEDWLEHLPAVLRNRTAQFWALQLVGFAGWGLTWVASGLYWGVEPAYNLAIAAGMVTGMLLTGVLREAYKAVWSGPLWVRLITLVVGSYLVALLWQMSKNVALVEFYGAYMKGDEVKFDSWVAYTRGTMTSFYIVLGWSGLYAGIKYYRMLVEERAKALRATNSAREAQLRMLRYQLNPHFLFNTLNAISTLVLEQDTQLANRMVTRLSSFLRYSLDSDPMQTVDLEQEVRALRLYLDIEQVRFEDRLTLDVRIDADAARARVPSLVLQPLVENAIKYAVARSEDGGTIRLLAHRTGSRVEIEVSDDGPGLPEGFVLDGAGRGVGLRNTADRLEQVFGADHQFELLPAAPHGLRVVIRIPFETADREGE
jgi:signal transduction histidine kinase